MLGFEHSVVAFDNGLCRFNAEPQAVWLCGNQISIAVGFQLAVKGVVYRDNKAFTVNYCTQFNSAGMSAEDIALAIVEPVAEVQAVVDLCRDREIRDYTRTFKQRKKRKQQQGG